MAAVDRFETKIRVRLASEEWSEELECAHYTVDKGTGHLCLYRYVPNRPDEEYIWRFFVCGEWFEFEVTEFKVSKYNKLEIIS